MVKRCLVITYYFPPFGGGGVQRISKLVKYLSREDWEFHVISAGNDISNLPTDNSLLNEIPNSVQVDRISGFSGIKKSPFRSSFFVRWLVSLFFIPDIRVRWTKLIKPHVLKIINKKHFDLILVSVPPYSLALLAMELKKTLKVPVVLDMRDAWTQDPLKIYPTIFHNYYDTYLENKTINSIDNIISVYKNNINYLKNKIKNRKQSLYLIPNGYDKEDIDLVIPKKLSSDYFHIAVSGTLYSHLNSLDFLFSAFQRVKSMKEEVFKKIKFHHLGHVQINLEKVVQYYKCKEIVKIWGYKPHQECLSILSAADAFCIIFDSKIKNSSNVIGGKIYEYMALKKPVLALAPETGETAELIKDTCSGEIIDPYKTEKIADILINWIETRDFSKYTFKNIENYSREKQAYLFKNVFDKVISQDIS